MRGEEEDGDGDEYFSMIAYVPMEFIISKNSLYLSCRNSALPLALPALLTTLQTVYIVGVCCIIA